MFEVRIELRIELRRRLKVQWERNSNHTHKYRKFQAKSTILPLHAENIHLQEGDWLSNQPCPERARS